MRPSIELSAQNANDQGGDNTNTSWGALNSKPYVPSGMTAAEFAAIKKRESDEQKSLNFGAFGPRWSRQSRPDGDWMLMRSLWTRGFDSNAPSVDGSGGSTVGGNDGQKSLAEIQREEEERRQREMAAKNEELLGMPQNAIGTAWATGKLASSSNPPPPQQQQPPPPKRPTMMMPRQMQGSQRKVQSDFDRPDSAGSAPRSNPGSHNNSIADNMNQIDGDSWGAPPAPKNKRALQQWCKRAMKTLNGSEDLTLVDFLLSLASAGEVQEYVGLYLGNTPKATEFGLELVKQKRADPSLKDGIARL